MEKKKKKLDFSRRYIVHNRKYPLLILPKHLQSLKLLRPTILGGDAFTRKYIISI